MSDRSEELLHEHFQGHDIATEEWRMKSEKKDDWQESSWVTVYLNHVLVPF